MSDTSDRITGRLAPRWIWVPLGLLMFFIGFAAWHLRQPEDNTIHSRMVGKPVPAITLPPASSTRPGITPANLKPGKPYLINIWASWCVPCAAEAPQLDALKTRGVPIVGIAIRDEPNDVDAFLARYGNPYTLIGADQMSAVQLDIGSSGVPETFVVDGKGIIRYQHIGDIRAEQVPLLLEQIEKASR